MYRVGKLSRDGKIYGVIADPVGHSISPAVHNRAFQARRVDAVYLPFLVDPVARRIGAVNTVWRKAGKWRGANTDAPGVTSPLERHVRLNKSSVLVVGNGGAARGAVFALAAAGSKLAVTGRNLDRVRALASTCGAEALSRDQ